MPPETELDRLRCQVRGVAALEDAAFVDYFGLRASEAKVLGVLYREAGAFRPERIGRVTKLTSGGVKTHVCTIRKAMNAGAVETVGAAYRLTAIGAEECRRAIQEFHQEQARAA